MTNLPLFVCENHNFFLHFKKAGVPDKSVSLPHKDSATAGEAGLLFASRVDPTDCRLDVMNEAYILTIIGPAVQPRASGFFAGLGVKPHFIRVLALFLFKTANPGDDIVPARLLPHTDVLLGGRQWTRIGSAAMAAQLASEIFRRHDFQLPYLSIKN